MESVILIVSFTERCQKEKMPLLCCNSRQDGVGNLNMSYGKLFISVKLSCENAILISNHLSLVNCCCLYQI